MAVGKMWRLALAVMVLAGTLVTQTAVSVAQDGAAVLVEEVLTHEVGDNAQIRLDDAADFASEGGHATFEPGTSNSETFTYQSVDFETNRLIGLTRPEPAAHPVGAAVEPVGSTDPQPVPSPAPESNEADPSGSAAPGDSTDPTTLDGAGSGATPDSSPSAGSTGGEVVNGAPAAEGVNADVSTQPDLCATVTGRTCVDIILDLINPNCEGDLCDVLDDPCGALDASCGATDSCDPDNTGQTCLQMILSLINPNCEGNACDVLDDPCGALGVSCGTTDPCDPDNTGQTCTQYIGGAVEDPCGAVNATCGVTQPCDPDRTGQTCEEWLAQFVDDSTGPICDPHDTGQTCDQLVLDYGGIGPIPEIEREGELSPADILLQEPALGDHCSSLVICTFPQEPKCAAERVRLKWIDKDSGDVMWWVQTRMVWCWDNGQITSENKEHSAGGDAYYINTNDIYIRWDGWLPGTGRVCEGGRCKSTVAIGSWCIYQGVPGANGVYRREPWAASVTGKVGGESSGSYWPLDPARCPKGPDE